MPSDLTPIAVPQGHAQRPKVLGLRLSDVSQPGQDSSESSSDSAGLPGSQVPYTRATAASETLADQAPSGASLGHCRYVTVAAGGMARGPGAGATMRWVGDSSDSETALGLAGPGPTEGHCQWQPAVTLAVGPVPLDLLAPYFSLHTGRMGEDPPWPGFLGPGACRPGPPGPAGLSLALAWHSGWHAAGTMTPPPPNAGLGSG